MRQQYNAEEHAQLIYETRLDDFFNYLATQTDLYEAMWCMFDEEKEPKHCQRVAYFIKRNKWKRQVYRLLENGNAHAWLLLTNFAKSERESNEWDVAASKADDLHSGANGALREIAAIHCH